MGRFKYNSGDVVGPNHILMLERTHKDKNGKWYGLFLCPDCQEPWETLINTVSRGKGKRCLKCKAKYQSGLGNPYGENLIGQTFGKLQVLDYGYSKNQHRFWKCKCSCKEQNIVYVRTEQLMQGYTTSCGCGRRKDISGKKYGLLIALEPTSRRNNNQAVIWKCKCDCGNIVYYSIDRLTIGEATSCGCVKSKGEQRIQQILQSLNIDFRKQKTFNDCRNPKTKSLLFFDFYLPEYNCCIEYDGIQHYEGWGKNSLSLQDNQEKDKIKNEYCKEKDIRLVRIPYWDYGKMDKNYVMEKIYGAGYY